MTVVQSSVPPGPKGVPLLGNAREFVQEPITYLQRCAREYGDIMQIRLGTTEVWHQGRGLQA
jgi:hypothetical protein